MYTGVNYKLLIIVNYVVTTPKFVYNISQLLKMSKILCMNYMVEN